MPVLSAGVHQGAGTYGCWAGPLVLRPSESGVATTVYKQTDLRGGAITALRQLAGSWFAREAGLQVTWCRQYCTRFAKLVELQTLSKGV